MATFPVYLSDQCLAGYQLGFRLLGYAPAPPVVHAVEVLCALKGCLVLSSGEPSICLLAAGSWDICGTLHPDDIGATQAMLPLACLQVSLSMPRCSVYAVHLPQKESVCHLLFKFADISINKRVG